MEHLENFFAPAWSIVFSTDTSSKEGEEKHDETIDPANEKGEGPEHDKPQDSTSKEEEEGKEEPEAETQKSGGGVGAAILSTVMYPLDVMVGGVSNLVGSNTKKDDKKPATTKTGGTGITITAAGVENKSLADIVYDVRESYEDENDVAEGNLSFTSILALVDQYREQVQDVAEKYLLKNDIDFDQISARVVHYYLEKEDEIKTPSWKRRRHRFCPGVLIDEVNYLQSMSRLAQISYRDTVEEIQTQLSEHADLPCELVYVQVASEPGRPANYVAVPRNQSMSGNSLHVVIGVRGTKTIADAVTDVLCDTAPYQNGFAHKYIMESGKYIHDKHSPLLRDLLSKSGKERIKLTLVGHSLGAGAASIAGMEWKANREGLDKMDVTVVGLGCPALVSENLAVQSSSFITTVIYDADVVPRMSGATIANLFLNMQHFDWPPYARRDVDHALRELHRKYPSFFTEGVVKKLHKKITPYLQSDVEGSTVKRRVKGKKGKKGKESKQGSGEGNESKLDDEGTESTLDISDTEEEGGGGDNEGQQRVIPVELFPPGKCVHFWRDGNGISANYVPNIFFDEIDVCRTMLDDHMFHSGYEFVLLEVMRQHKGDQNFRFDQDAEAVAQEQKVEPEISPFSTAL